MRNIRGRGGCLFLVSERAPLDLALVDCDGGWDWQAADQSRSLWLEEELGFHADGAQPVLIEAWHGKVGFDRCLRGHSVSVQGFCQPLARVASATSWDLALPIDGGGKCLLTDWRMEEIGECSVLVHLPFAAGAFRAFGYLQEPVADQPLRVDLEGEVRHGGSA